MLLNLLHNLLPSSQTSWGEQFVQGRFALVRVGFEPTALRLPWQQFCRYSTARTPSIDLYDLLIILLPVAFQTASYIRGALMSKASWATLLIALKSINLNAFRALLDCP